MGMESSFEQVEKRSETLTERCFNGADNMIDALFLVHASRVNLARAQGRLEQLRN
jgi:hypothetical protein